MKTPGDHSLAVVGAGLVGSLLALILANRGYQVTVYERRADPRKVGDASGRSINLALSERGWRALELAAGIAGRNAVEHEGEHIMTDPDVWPRSCVLCELAFEASVTAN